MLIETLNPTKTKKKTKQKLYIQITDEAYPIWSTNSGRLKLIKRKGTALTRKNSVIYTRLKIGHPKLTHQFLVTNDDIPFCVGCQKNVTIKHILSECIDFKDIRV